MPDDRARATSGVAAGVVAALVVGSVVVGAVVFAAPASSQHASGPTSDWPVDRGDAARTGATAGHGPGGPYADTKWTKSPDEIPGKPTGLVTANGTVFLSVETWDEAYYEQTGALYAYDAATGAERWNRSDLAAVETAPAVQNGTLYAAATLTPPEDDPAAPTPDSGTGGLFALDAATGETIWKTNHNRSWGHGGSPTIANGIVYADTREAVYAIDADTGEERWRWSTPGGYSQGFAVVDGTVYAVHGRNVSAVNATTGETRWTTTVEDADGSLTAPAVANGGVYVSSQPDRVHRLSTEGEVEWTATLENSLDASVPNRVTAPAVDDGAVFVATDDDYDRDAAEGQSIGTVHRLDAATGEETWRFETAADLVTAPSVTGSAVFVGGQYRSNSSTAVDRSNVVYALNRSDGTERWSYALDASIISHQWATLAPANERLYLAIYEAGPLTFHGSVAVLNSTDTPPEPWHQLAPDEPTAETHPPLVEIETEPRDAESRDLDAGDNVTLTANATDIDGTVTTIEWDVDGDGEYERTAESIDLELTCGDPLEVTVRVTDDDGLRTTESVTLSAS